MQVGRTVRSRIPNTSFARTDAAEVEALFAGLERSAREQLDAQDIPAERQSTERHVEVRFMRQTKALEVCYTGSPPQLVRDFLAVYAHRYGDAAVPELAGFELVTFVVLARGALRRPHLRGGERARGAVAPVSHRPVFDPVAGEFLPTPVYVGEELAPGHELEGPAVIQYATTTLALCSAQHARINDLLAVEIRAAR